MTFMFYFSIPTIFKSLFYKNFHDNEYPFHFLVFINACKLCYSRDARSQSERIQHLFQYFHSRLDVLYGYHSCTMNFHLLLHLHTQVREFGTLASCSMFSFERQFYNFKVYKHGVRSLLQQLCEKITLMKHCKSFLSVTDFHRKPELLKCISLNIEEDCGFHYKNGGVIYKGGRPFFSKAFGKNVSYFYKIQMEGRIFFGSIINFFEHEGIFGTINFMKRKMLNC